MRMISTAIHLRMIMATSITLMLGLSTVDAFAQGGMRVSPNLSPPQDCNVCSGIKAQQERECQTYANQPSAYQTCMINADNIAARCFRICQYQH